ncbi:hypothetical protein [Rheinheimera hassiensis]|uniref:hypothetical protein n=1 Tax=Rheinheimera hassiensis TaxID=1193627 RepID=UPI001F0619D2|nr:hypothetical protein [Rheinheimera hassiensis]
MAKLKSYCGLISVVLSAFLFAAPTPNVNHYIGMACPICLDALKQTAEEVVVQINTDTIHNLVNSARYEQIVTELARKESIYPDNNFNIEINTGSIHVNYHN